MPPHRRCDDPNPPNTATTHPIAVSQTAVSPWVSFSTSQNGTGKAPRRLSPGVMQGFASSIGGLPTRCRTSPHHPPNPENVGSFGSSRRPRAESPDPFRRHHPIRQTRRSVPARTRLPDIRARTDYSQPPESVCVGFPARPVAPIRTRHTLDRLVPHVHQQKQHHQRQPDRHPQHPRLPRHRLFR